MLWLALDHTLIFLTPDALLSFRHQVSESPFWLDILFSENGYAAYQFDGNKAYNDLHLPSPMTGLGVKTIFYLNVVMLLGWS